MANIDFSGLMSGVEKTEDKRFDFSGLMDAPTIEPEKLKKDDSYVKSVISAPEKVADMIDERGTLWEQYTADTSGIGYGKTFLQNISLPSQMLESGLSNPVIEMQRGNFNPIDLIVESAKGFAGLKQGQYGDIARQTGAGEKTSATIGLGTSFLVPMALMKMGKNLSAVSRFKDKEIFKSITKFFKVVEKKGGAMNKVGGKVGAYYDDIGNVAVDKTRFLDEGSKMTSTIKRSITDMPTDKLKIVEDELLDLIDNGDINSVHKAKEVVDDLITNYFSATSKTQKALKGHSKVLGGIIDDAAYNTKVRQIGREGAAKYVSNFQKARKDYSVLKSNFGFIKNKLVNPYTGQPTQTGSILKEINDPRNIDIRKTLANIDKYGTKANRFARELESIEKAIESREFASSALKSAGRGLVIGATAGTILKRKDKIIDSGEK